MAEQVESEQGRISYSIRGTGPPLILLPGFQSSSVAWIGYGYPEQLSHFRTIMIDPLGHGKSHKSHDQADYEIERVVDQTLAVLDAEGIDQAPFVGFSRGGWIVAQMLDLCPERMTAGIIGAAPLGEAFSETMAGLKQGLAPLLEGDWARYWDSYPVPLPQELQDMFEAVNDPKACGAALAAMIGWPAAGGLSPTGVPRLAYFGTGEVFADRLRSVLDSRGVSYDERDWAGHAETMSDAIGVSKIISEFIGSVPGPEPRVSST